MLNQDVEPKQPNEIKTYNGDWRRRLAVFPGVTIVGSTWTPVTTDGQLGVSGSAIDALGQQTSFQASNGTAGYVYVLRNTVTLSDGQVWHAYGALEVAAEGTLLRY